MSKKYYIAIVMQSRVIGKRFAYVLVWYGEQNLVSHFTHPRILSANICDSEKEAYRIVEEWNNEFRKNGVFGT